MESFVSVMKDFARIIRENTSPPVAGIDGRIPVVMGLRPLFLSIILTYALERKR